MNIRSMTYILGWILNIEAGFMLLPIGLVFLAGKLEFVTDLINGSFFAHFFYRSNFLLSMMPGV